MCKKSKILFKKLVYRTKHGAIIKTGYKIELSIICIEVKIHIAAINSSSNQKNIVRSSGPRTEP